MNRSSWAYLSGDRLVEGDALAGSLLTSAGEIGGPRENRSPRPSSILHRRMALKTILMYEAKIAVTSRRKNGGIEKQRRRRSSGEAVKM